MRDKDSSSIRFHMRCLKYDISKIQLKRKIMMTKYVVLF